MIENIILKVTMILLGIVVYDGITPFQVDLTN